MVCQKCGEEVEQLQAVKVGSKRLKLCDDCYDRLQEEQEIAEEAEGAMQGMMEYKGRR